MDKIDLIHILESIIFASDRLCRFAKWNRLFEGVWWWNVPRSKMRLQRLQDELQNRAFFFEKKLRGGYILATRPEYAPYVKKMFSGKERSRLSRAALETLAIIAFKQPISRVEINAIRGVDSDGVIKGLLERRLIDISGRDDGPGRALLFRTTAEFLKYFGFDDISELPKAKRNRTIAGEGFEEGQDSAEYS
jgi:segregation and condensation protein B